MLKKFFAVLCVVLMTLLTAACTQENTPVVPDKPAVTQTEKHTVTVYRLPADGTEMLYAEKVTVEGDSDEQPLLALEALINTKPQDEKLVNAFPQGLKILSLTVDKGVAVVDLSKEIYNIEAGSYTEMMLTQAMTNTLTEFPNIKEVTFLIEGKKEASIKGHIDLLDAFERDTTMIAK